MSAFRRASMGQVIRPAATSFVNPVEYQIVNMPQPSRILHPIVLVSLLTSGLTTVLSNTPALADGPSDVQILRTDIGFKGRFKVGCWTPITISLETSQPLRAEWTVSSPDPEGATVIYQQAPIDISKAGRHEFQGQFQLGQMYSRLVVEVSDDSGVLDRRQLTPGSEINNSAYQPLRQTTRLILTWGNPGGFESTASDAHAATTGEDGVTHVIPIDELSQFPDQHSELDSVDAIVLAGDFQLSKSQNAALQTWVRQGGHLIISAGKTFQQFAASPLAEWIPIQFGGDLVSLRQITGLESLANNADRLVIMGRLQIPIIQNQTGRVLVSELDHPVILQLPIGFGRVTYSGVDFDRPPLLTWEPLRVVCEKILGTDSSKLDTQTDVSRSRLSHSGISDLATQLNAAQELFPQLRRPSVWMTMGFMFVYLLCIGPLDYLLVRRVLKRPELTWITFPSLAVVASLLAVTTARSWNGDQLLVNQFEVIDLALPGAGDRDATRPSGTSLIRNQTWVTLYSPDSRRFHLDLSTQSIAGMEPTPTRIVDPLFWTGIPEDTFGGMYRGGGFDVGRPAYQYRHGQSDLTKFPIRVWSTRSLHASSSQQVSEGPLQAQLSSHGVGQLSGELTLHLTTPITDWILAFRSRVYLPRQDLQPQVTFPPPGLTGEPDWEAIPQRELRAYLTNTTTRQIKSRKIAGVEFQTSQGVYDPQSRDLSHIVKMMTFYGAAGGRSYTRLTNGSLRALDLSKLLPLNCAILLGRIELPAAQFQVDDQPVPPVRRVTYFRVVIPVTSNATEFLPLPAFDD